MKSHTNNQITNCNILRCTNYKIIAVSFERFTSVFSEHTLVCAGFWFGKILFKHCFVLLRDKYDRKLNKKTSKSGFLVFAVKKNETGFSAGLFQVCVTTNSSETLVVLLYRWWLVCLRKLKNLHILCHL